MTRAAFALGLVLLALPARARADEGDAFYAAVALEQQGKYAESAAAHEAIAARAPQDPFADDALIEAARLYEEKLGQPLRAAETYERVVRDYPGSRQAARAERRVQLLREGLGADGRGEPALAAWNDILNGFPTRTRRASLALAQQLLAAQPGWILAPRVLHWVGEQQQQLGEHEAALASYRAVQQKWPGDDWALRARRSEADELTALGRFAEAEAVYTSLRGAQPGGPYAKELSEAVVRMQAARAHARLETGAWIALALLVLAAAAGLRRDTGSLAAAARALVRPPLELIYLLPVAVLLAAAGQTENEAIARATLWLSGAMLVVTWFTGVGIVAARRALGRLPLARVLAHGTGGGAAMLAAAYLIVRRLDLLDFIIHTVRFGVD